MKVDAAYAAIEQNKFPNTIYVNKQLADADKLLIAAYLIKPAIIKKPISLLFNEKNISLV